MSALIFTDTETTGLEVYDEIWEFAAIRREPDGAERAMHAFIDHSPSLCARLPESFRADHLARFPGVHNGICDGTGLGTFDREHAAQMYADVLSGDPRPHIVGAVPNFDTERIAGQIRRRGGQPGWHYHLIDVENLAVGYLCGRAPRGGWVQFRPPWKSDELSRLCGVDPLPESERHTALGDARWAMRLYDAITGGTA